MKTIVYCAIHKRTLVNEVLYSILNVAEVCCDIENYRFVVITDMPEEFKLVASIVKMRLGMPIIIEPISKAITENWLGPYRYVYRLRIKALQYYYSKYQENALFIAANMIVLQDCRFCLSGWMKGVALCISKDCYYMSCFSVHIIHKQKIKRWTSRYVKSF